MKKLMIATGLIATGLAASTATAHADNASDYLTYMHGQTPGTTHMTAVSVPGGDAELISLAKIACTAYDTDTTGASGLAATAAVRAAEPHVTFAKRDPRLDVTDAAMFVELGATMYYCP